MKPIIFIFQNWGQREDAKDPEQKKKIHAHTYIHTVPKIRIVLNFSTASVEGRIQ